MLAFGVIPADMNAAIVGFAKTKPILPVNIDLYWHDP